MAAGLVQAALGGGLSFGLGPVGVHISLENRLHPGDVSFPLGFEKGDDLLLKTQVNGLLGLRQD